MYGGFSFQILDPTRRVVEGVTAPFVGREKSAEENANCERLRDLYEIAAAGSSFEKSGLRPPCVLGPYRLSHLAGSVS